jgi:hypothetical protein
MVTFLETAAWVISAVLLAWMVVDAIKVSRTYDEEFLTTSVEGTDELFDPAPPAGGGAR